MRSATLSMLLLAGALAGCSGSSGAVSSGAVSSGAAPRVAASDPALAARKRAGPRHARQRRETGRSLAPATSGLRGWSLGRLVGQKLVVAFRGTLLPPAELLSRVRRGEVGGVILFAENGAASGRLAVARTTDLLQRAAQTGRNPPLIVATDQEGGPVKRLPGPPWESPARMGTGSPSSILRSGYQTGRSLRGMGVNVDLAPVTDAPPDLSRSFLGERAFGENPARVAGAAEDFARGLQLAGVAATAKHYPGLGSAGEADTDSGLVVLSTPLRRLRRERSAFLRQVRGGTKLMMVSNALYSAYDPNHLAVLSSKIIGRLRREGFHGVLISDDLDVPELRSRGAAAPREAVDAGVDLLLYGNDGGSAYQALLDGSRGGRIPRPLLEEQVVRILRLKRWLGSRASALGSGAGAR